MSPPARVAWIETLSAMDGKTQRSVATREGGVDRNILKIMGVQNGCFVATREGGVDRNERKCQSENRNQTSPPARVAWIETETRLKIRRPK